MTAANAIASALKPLAEAQSQSQQNSTLSQSEFQVLKSLHALASLRRKTSCMRIVYLVLLSSMNKSSVFERTTCYNANRASLFSELMNSHKQGHVHCTRAAISSHYFTSLYIMYNVHVYILLCVPCIIDPCYTIIRSNTGQSSKYKCFYVQS